MTILTGDLNGDDGPNFVNYGENSLSVVRGNGADDTCIVDGFTIQGGSNLGGKGAGIYNGTVSLLRTKAVYRNCKITLNQTDAGLGLRGSGGGVFNDLFTEPTFDRCEISWNHAEGGGGMYNAEGSKPVLTECVVSNNIADAAGGGIYAVASDGRYTDCVFQSNVANGGQGGGGFVSTGIHENNANPILRRCAFIDNAATFGPGGGLRVIKSGEPILVECLFQSNVAHYEGGGGLFRDSPGVVKLLNCRFEANEAIDSASIGGGVAGALGCVVEATNCLFVGNSADLGAAIALEGALGEVHKITNCTIVGNTCSATDGGGGIHYTFGASLQVRNCILWDNARAGGSVIDRAAQLFQLSSPDTTLSVDYSCVRLAGGAAFPGVGSISADPRFLDPSSGDYGLQPCSPCVDSGFNSAIPPDEGDIDEDANTVEEVPWDLPQGARKVDNAVVPPGAVVVDMGAFEQPYSCTVPCDLSGDGFANGVDIQIFVAALLGSDASQPMRCAADFNHNAVIDFDDIPCFVQVILPLAYPRGCVFCESGSSLFGEDCNGNGEPDANDIAAGTSQDCNGNLIPDSCDSDETDPDGNESVSADVNGNSVPDECEPDCNGNSVPDAWDIGQQTSADVNANGIPDECEADCNQNDLPDSYELAQQTVPDCNANGIPDGCEADCNDNGVPDDCDIDPSDPDGNSSVSPDCNANGLPDSCDLSLPPPFGSVDCNSNGIPDECDIGSGHCWDENNNGVCDNCEGGSMEGRSNEQAPNRAPTVREESALDGEDTAEGGNGNTAEGGCATFARGSTPAEEAAWEAYYEWSMEQTWGADSPLTGEEQFLLIQEQAMELGLDVAEIVRR